jgi:Protein of unknown function (DUF2992).
MKLTVFHDGQYWVGVLEEQCQGKLRAAKYIFGSEPKDEEILQFVCKDMMRIVGGLSQEVAVKHSEAKRISPKRLARRAAEEMRNKGVSSYAQEAIRLELEKRKRERRTLTKQQLLAKLEHKRELKIRKAKEKHRGR